MQVTAEFLFEPKARAAGDKGQSGLLAVAREQQAGNRFASVFAEQQRRSSQPVAQKPSARTEPARAEHNRNTDSARQRTEHKQPEQRAEQTPKHTDAGNADTKAQHGKEQSQESDAEAVVVNKSVQDEQQLPSEGWAQLDPLLQQVMQANQVSVELNPELEEQVDDFLLEGVDAIPQGVFSDLLGQQSVSDDKTQKVTDEAGKLTSSLRQLATQESKEVAEQDGEEATPLTTEQELSELELELQPEEEPVLSQVLAMRGAEQPKQQSNTSFSAQMNNIDGNHARNESLLRSESVQQTSNARQLPGQPLNMQQPGWSKELTDKVMWMSARNLKSAEIRLNPAELGRLEIRVQVQNEQTQVSFVSPHANVRDSLDTQMHRLREMLAQQGMQDVDVNVSDQSSDEQEQRQLHGLMMSGAQGRVTEPEAEVVEAVTELPQQNSGTDGRLSYYV